METSANMEYTCKQGSWGKLGGAQLPWAKYSAGSLLWRDFCGSQKKKKKKVGFLQENLLEGGNTFLRV